jgi:acid stress-induced BolA-like protein IbaG/YrbA
MLDLESFSAKLKQSLEGYLDQPSVRAIPGDFHKVLGVIVSPTFEGMDEADRQEIVWDRVLKTFPASEHTWIEFLYTDAPSEIDESDQPEESPSRLPND